MAPARTGGLAIVNTGSQPLVLSNLSAREALPMPEPDEGAADAYRVCERYGRPSVEPDERYGGLRPALYPSSPTRAPERGLTEEVPLYSAFVHHPEQFRWLLTGELTAAGAS